VIREVVDERVGVGEGAGDKERVGEGELRTECVDGNESECSVRDWGLENGASEVGVEAVWRLL
jgi:hypothetical protein